MDLKETDCEGEGVIHMTQELVSMVKTLGTF
jgi:hypothetical protein